MHTRATNPTAIQRAFDRAVNMTAAEIEAWLQTGESKSVGMTRPGDKESVGRQSARKIIHILRKGPQGPADYQHMRKVAGYVKRHLAQRPQGDVRDTRWRYSLMNWGHDPLQEVFDLLGKAAPAESTSKETDATTSEKKRFGRKRPRQAPCRTARR